jgi:hypothetical protein
MGGLLFVSAVATYFLLPDVGKSPDSSKAEGTTLITASGFEMFTMLRIPVIAMIAYSILSTAGGVGFLSVALEPHLRQVINCLSKFKQKNASPIADPAD